MAPAWTASREFGDALLLARVEGAQILAARYDGARELSSGQVMEDEALLAGIHHFAGGESSVFLDELLLVRERLQGVEDRLVDGSRRVAIGEAFRHGYRAALDALGREEGAHVDPGEAVEFFIGCTGVEVAVGDHGSLHLFPYDT